MDGIWQMTFSNTFSLKEKETQHSFAGLLNIYISGIWL